ncbi:MAG: Gfo/Idh/MocA family protein [Flavitalea sp.]
MRIIFVLIFSLIVFICDAQQQKPVRLAVAGISHGHNGWILGRKNDAAVELVGIYEPVAALREKAIRNFKLDPKLFYSDLSKMLTELKPDGLCAFGATNEHLEVVKQAAPKGIPVMVEKPLATTVKDAEEIAALSKKYNVLILTNFETSWYPTTDKTYELTRDTSFMGKIRKVVIHSGHEGPKEIGVSDEFFEWLTDPVKNGGGALTDFGCYGANLMTYLMNGEKPLAVTAVTQQFKPHIYPKVDDEATIVVTYPTAQAIIQASWNWPYSRKDMAVYGEHGYAITSDHKRMEIKSGKEEMKRLELEPDQTGTYTSPFLYFADVIRKKITVPANGLYSLENNLMVVRILEAARQSAQTGKAVKISQ